MNVNNQDIIRKCSIAYDIATKSLESNRKLAIANDEINENVKKMPDRVSPSSGILLWDDSTYLFEFPFTNDLGEDKGYIIISPDKHLPPIFEYCYTGKPLSSILTQTIQSHMISNGQIVKELNLFYWNGCILFAECKLDGKEGYTYVKFPNLSLHYSKTKVKVSRNPELIWSDLELSNYWKGLDGYEFVLDKMPSKTLSWAKPVKYQQACDTYLSNGIIAQSPPVSNYCTPRCIMGCAPVAWALLSSSYKSHPKGESFSHKIWPNSNCWDTPWPSSASQKNPVKCKEVATTIWDFGRAMGTTCTGITNSKNTVNGHTVFNSKWGINWRWKYYGSWSFRDVGVAIAFSKPFILGGIADWDVNLKKVLGIIPNSPPGESVGHSVLCYGRKKEDGTVLISLGWGRSFRDKWMNYSSISRPDATLANQGPPYISEDDKLFDEVLDNG